MKITRAKFVYFICIVFSIIGMLVLFKSFNDIDNEYQSKEQLFKERLNLFSTLIFFSFGGISYYLITKNKSNNTFKLIGVILSSIAFIFNGLVLYFYPEMFSKGTLLFKKTIAIITIILFGTGLLIAIYKLITTQKPRKN